LGAREVTLYREALQARGKNPDDFSIVNSRLIYIAETPEKAWDVIREAAMYQAELYGKWLSANIAANQDWIRPDPEKIKRGALLGPPDFIAESLAKIIDSNPMTELILNMQLPGLEPAKAMRSLERFAADVLPKLRRT
jgi:alkanesulfonate monooxygenase SsuD/methylene tetrahydromethanopterin reductase-like flavin-dependent oxidoreductase (luciferase family)